MGNSTPQKFEPGFDTSAEEKISQLLSAMPRVEAPGDFGFQVKARIAKGQPATGRPLWLPTAIKAAVPLGLVLAIGGYVGITSLYVNNAPAGQQAFVEPVRPGLEQSVPAAAAPEPVAPVVAAAVPRETEVVPARTTREVAVKAELKRAVNRKPIADKDSGDLDIALRGTQSPSLPKDTESKPDVAIKGTPAGEVLTRLGVNALFGEGGWKADSVSPNTAAAKAGVKAGDIIESVDDQDLADLGSVAKPAVGKKLKVKRDGKSIEIVID